jgi:hypothetical protein
MIEENNLSPSQPPYHSRENSESSKRKYTRGAKNNAARNDVIIRKLPMISPILKTCFHLQISNYIKVS